jgi:hypothetical protein
MGGTKWGGFDMRKHEITHEKLLAELFYDLNTGIFVRKKSCKGRKTGEKVGHLRNDGYLVTTFHGKFFYLHRLAWFYVYGQYPENLIDHIDRNKSNNKINNLRKVNYLQNSQNLNRHKDNQSGYKGVWKHSNTKWRSGICVDGKMKYLGTFDDVEKAHIAYQKASKELQIYGVYSNV